MSPRSSAPRTARIAADSDDEESDLPETSSRPRSRRRDSNASSSDGFDDNFAPFVSAASRDATLSAALSSPSLDDTSVPTFPSESDYTPFDDAGEEDPTAHLAEMFASFAGLREKALNMQDRNQKMDFAEDIAMKFAKQLDLLMGDDLDETPKVPLPNDKASSNGPTGTGSGTSPVPASANANDPAGRPDSHTSDKPQAESSELAQEI